MSSFKETRRLGARLLQNKLDHPKAQWSGFGYTNATALWASFGFPTFCLDGKRAAAFSATSCSRELLNLLILPFETFGILLEPGLFTRTIGPDSGFLLVNKFDAQDGTRGIELFSFVDDEMFSFDCSLQYLLDEDLNSEFDDSGQEIGLEDRYSTFLIGKLIVGLCLSLDRIQAVPNFQDVKRQVHLNKDKQKLPGYIEYKFTKPVDIDIRKEVREYSKSGGGALMLRTLVRGYWRLAACGKGRMERRPVHVMPYWRGPIDAPIALQCPKDDDNLPTAGPWENLCR